MIATPEYIIAHNSPEAFWRMSAEGQAALRAWVRLAIEAAAAWNTARGEHGRWHSYNLKHHAESALRHYVGNGEMKGAMLAEGYTDYQGWGSRESPDINWTFRAQRRCPHKMGRAVVGSFVDPCGGALREIREYGFACPGALLVESMYTRWDGKLVTATYPALCQATPEEVAELARRRAAWRLAERVEHAV